MPTYDGDKHFGSRLAFGPDAMLYVTLGERSDAPMRPQAQQLDSHMGKILRIRPDGSAPTDNPFAGQPNALPEIWTLGHRNVQAAAFDPQGRFWVVEHGTRGGDELNLIEKGKNYGWPLVAYGEEYFGLPIRGAVTDRPGFEQPRYYYRVDLPGELVAELRRWRVACPPGAHDLVFPNGSGNSGRAWPLLFSPLTRARHGVR
jgi:aldose sugar dehydrogenase